MSAERLDPRALEVIAARGWPAARTASLGGWLLRASAGFSGRINACWPLGDPGRPWPDAVAATEAWYAQVGLPSRFKVVAQACEPPDLIERLTQVGYRPRTETLMMVGPAHGAADAGVRLSATLDPAFIAVFEAAGEGGPGDARERLDALARVPSPRAFAQIDHQGAPAAIGASAVDDDWVGVFAMRTDPLRRRRGLARRVFGALLAAAAAARGARRAWLQVEATNAAAVSLYRRSGFEEAYRYGYWEKAPPGR